MRASSRGHERGSFDSKSQPPWDSVREHASEARMRIAAEIRQAHMIHFQQLPPLREFSVKAKDCGASGAASLSSLLDKVLLEHVSSVPSRVQLVEQKQREAAAAAIAAQVKLQPLQAQQRGRRGAVVCSVDGARGTPDNGERGPKRVGLLPFISEDVNDGSFGRDQSNFLHRQCDGISIKSRTQSRQGGFTGAKGPFAAHNRKSE